MTQVRLRVAPSPTGDPHVGTAYIALFNYVFAKQHNGRFILRIEDTDQQRSKPAWEEMIISSLRRLGLEWDEGPDIGGEFGPYRQSERQDIYREHAETLMEQGSAYKCYCDAERLAEMRKLQRERKETSRYDGHCRDLTPSQREQLAASGKPFVVRLKVPRDGQTVVFKERLRGEVSINCDQIDDQVLLKSDGMPTYHLANVVDDHLMKITHVMRAEEWITSTPKHVLLYQAFGWQMPEWIHLPLLRNQDKSKISKRKNPVSLNYYQDAGYLPAALLNYLATIGWTMPDERDKFTLPELVEAFDIDKVSLGGPIFDVAKLTWLNGVYLRDQSVADLSQQLKDEMFKDERFEKIVALVHERIETLEQFWAQTSYFFTTTLIYDDATQKLLIPKGRTAKEMRQVFEAVLEKIDAMVVLDAEKIEEVLRSICTQMDFKPKEVFMPVRVAMTASKATPPLFETMAVLGKERCRKRLRDVLGLLKKL